MTDNNIPKVATTFPGLLHLSSLEQLQVPILLQYGCLCQAIQKEKKRLGEKWISVTWQSVSL
jgi:hypothetical protein